MPENEVYASFDSPSIGKGERALREIAGFVCLARVVEFEYEKELLFDRQGNHGHNGYENLVSNGLVPYETIEEAKIGQYALQERGYFNEVSLGYLIISAAESEQEIDASQELAASSSLVVIWTNDGGDQLIGRRVEGRPGNYPMPGAFMMLNGSEPIQDLDSAKYIAWQTSRQSGGSPVTIAAFQLTMV